MAVTNTEIARKIDALDKRTIRRIEHLEKDVEANSKLLRGNGDEGLCSQIAVLKDRVDRLLFIGGGIIIIAIGDIAIRLL